jgi:hypothetical protein
MVGGSTFLVEMVGGYLNSDLRPTISVTHVMGVTLVTHVTLNANIIVMCHWSISKSKSGMYKDVSSSNSTGRVTLLKV